MLITFTKIYNGVTKRSAEMFVPRISFSSTPMGKLRETVANGDSEYHNFKSTWLKINGELDIETSEQIHCHRSDLNVFNLLMSAKSFVRSLWHPFTKNSKVKHTLENWDYC